jgi:DnaJ-class molecular chaperone
MDKSKAYRIFDLQPPLAENDIKSRYKQLIQKYHPDRLQEYNHWSHIQMNQLAQAQDILLEKIYQKKLKGM